MVYSLSAYNKALLGNLREIQTTSGFYNFKKKEVEIIRLTILWSFFGGLKS